MTYKQYKCVDLRALKNSIVNKLIFSGAYTYKLY